MRGYEGREYFPLKPVDPGKSPTWCLILDQYLQGSGYQLFITHDLSGGQFTSAPNFTFPFLVRHGAVLPVTVTVTELDRLRAASWSH